MFNFGSQGTKDELEKLRASELKLRGKYKKNLAQYKDTLADYQEVLTEYENRVRTNNDVSSRVEAELAKITLDFLYLKEQGNHLIEDIEKVGFIKLDQLKASLDRLESDIKSVKDTQVEMKDYLAQSEKRTKNLKSKLNFIGFITFLGTAISIFMLLVQLEVIVL